MPAPRKPPRTPEDLLPLTPAAFHILVALAEGDRHGYAIMQEVAERSGGRVRLNPGTLYTNMRRLLEQGLIVELTDKARYSTREERRRLYRLSDAGRHVIQLELQRLDRLLALGRRAGLVTDRS
ncbi:MAG: helix-turn-helix transcriptional regulator [Acidobacteriota bacterium]|nr:helix-turn-helix transcriptional regulator [Acidobacteriota bacterium]